MYRQNDALQPYSHARRQTRTDAAYSCSIVPKQASSKSTLLRLNRSPMNYALCKLILPHWTASTFGHPGHRTCCRQQSMKAGIFNLNFAGDLGVERSRRHGPFASMA